MPSTAEWRKELERAAGQANQAERGVAVASVLAEALRSIGQDPILVGGAAVEFYTEGGYSTSDIDMVAAGGPDLRKVMEELGFTKEGKDYVHPKLKIYVEFPGSRLKPEEKEVTIRVGRRSLRIISIEDLIVDRLCAYKFWQSAIDGLNALKLLELGEEDPNRLADRVSQEDVGDALRAIQEALEKAIRLKLPPLETNEILVKKMKSLKTSRP